MKSHIPNFLKLVNAFVDKYGAELDLLLDEGFLRTLFRRHAAEKAVVDVEIGRTRNAYQAVPEVWKIHMDKGKLMATKGAAKMQLSGLGSHDVSIVYTVPDLEIVPFSIELKSVSDIGSKNSRIVDSEFKKDIFRSLRDPFVGCLFVLDEAAFNKYVENGSGPVAPPVEWLQAPSSASIRDYFRSLFPSVNNLPDDGQWIFSVTQSHFGTKTYAAARCSHVDNNGQLGPKRRVWLYFQKVDDLSCSKPAKINVEILGECRNPPVADNLLSLTLRGH
jgi:hypothetical protein